LLHVLINLVHITPMSTFNFCSKAIVVMAKRTLDVDKRILRRRKKEFYSRGLLKRSIFSRSSYISSDLLGRRVSIYNGCRYKDIVVSKKNIGHKFGEFSFSKQLTYSIHSNNKPMLKKKRKLLQIQQRKKTKI